MTKRAADSGSRVIRFRVAGDLDPNPAEGSAILTLSQSEALDLIAWLGLPREEWGVLDSMDVAARCRRRLWPEARNLDPERVVRDAQGYIIAKRPAGSLRRWTQQMLKLCQRADARPILFA